jgi:phospholipase C
MIEWRFGLDPLSVRDAEANNMAAELDLAGADLSAPEFAVPSFPFSVPCLP